jgi:SM-20-related protein
MAAPALWKTAFSQVVEKTTKQLEKQGYVILQDILPENLLNDLLQHLQSLDDEKFNRAGVGREKDYHLNRFIRRDEIHWLEGSHPVTRDYFRWIEKLRNALNRQLFLGLFEYECHYAFYPPGAFYKKHLDAFKGTNSRILSTVLYLNPGWLAGDGGELVIYHPVKDEVLEVITPDFGKMVIFLSEEFPHEVLPAKTRRYSLTGWFRKNNSLSQSIDPLL